MFNDKNKSTLITSLTRINNELSNEDGNLENLRLQKYHIMCGLIINYGYMGNNNEEAFKQAMALYEFIKKHKLWETFPKSARQQLLYFISDLATKLEKFKYTNVIFKALICEGKDNILLSIPPSKDDKINQGLVLASNLNKYMLSKIIQRFVKAINKDNVNDVNLTEAFEHLIWDRLIDLNNKEYPELFKLHDIKNQKRVKKRFVKITKSAYFKNSGDKKEVTWKILANISLGLADNYLMDETLDKFRNEVQELKKFVRQMNQKMNYPKHIKYFEHIINAHIYEKKQNFQQSISEYLKAREYDKIHTYAITKLAPSYLEIGNTNEALKYTKMLPITNPPTRKFAAIMYNKLANIVWNDAYNDPKLKNNKELMMPKIKKAGYCLEQAKKLDPNNINSYIINTYVCLFTGNTKQALDDYATACIMAQKTQPSPSVQNTLKQLEKQLGFRIETNEKPDDKTKSKFTPNKRF